MEMSHVDRKMSILTDGYKQTDSAKVETSLIESVLNNATRSATEKLFEISELCKKSREQSKNDELQQIIDMQRAELGKLRQAPDHRSINFVESKKRNGIYIRSTDAAHHPMIRSCSIVRMMIIMFGMLLVTVPLFVAISTDMQTMSMAFFVITLLLSGYIAYNFVETREQELLATLGEIDETQIEAREPSLGNAFASFVAAVFVQLVYALYVSKTVVSTFFVVVVTLVSCMLLFASYGWLVTFERKYVFDCSK